MTTLSEALTVGDDMKACCAALYGHPAVRWLLGEELHPGGEATTRRALGMVDAQPGERLLDVASGAGGSALLAAREFGCSATGLEYGAAAVDAARQAAEASGLSDQASFLVGDAELLPFGEGSFDLVLCECSLCTFPDKRRAVSEIARVLRPGGRVALADVVLEARATRASLDGPLAVIACMGEALPGGGYERLLADAGLRVSAVESCAAEAAALAERVHDRLRGVRLLGMDRAEGLPVAVEDALELVANARAAIASGELGYSLFAASG